MQTVNIRIPGYTAPIEIGEANGVIRLTIPADFRNNVLLDAEDMTRLIDAMRTARASARESEKKS